VLEVEDERPFKKKCQYITTFTNDGIDWLKREIRDSDIKESIKEMAEHLRLTGRGNVNCLEPRY
jgi:hypothetical protein